VWSPKGTTLRVIRCPTLQVSQFLFPGQRSDTFLTDLVAVQSTGVSRLLLCRKHVLHFEWHYQCGEREKENWFKKMSFHYYSFHTAKNLGQIILQ